MPIDGGTVPIVIPASLHANLVCKGHVSVKVRTITRPRLTAWVALLFWEGKKWVGWFLTVAVGIAPVRADKESGKHCSHSLHSITDCPVYSCFMSFCPQEGSSGHLHI